MEVLGECCLSMQCTVVARATWSHEVCSKYIICMVYITAGAPFLFVDNFVWGHWVSFATLWSYLGHTHASWVLFAENLRIPHRMMEFLRRFVRASGFLKSFLVHVLCPLLLSTGIERRSLLPGFKIVLKYFFRRSSPFSPRARLCAGRLKSLRTTSPGKYIVMPVFVFCIHSVLSLRYAILDTHIPTLVGLQISKFWRGLSVPNQLF